MPITSGRKRTPARAADPSAEPSAAGGLDSRRPVRRFFRRASIGQLAAAGDYDRVLRSLEPRESDFITRPDGLVDLGSERRAEAAQSLVDAPGDEVTEALCRRLDDFSPEVRLAALGSLCRRADNTEPTMVAALFSWPEQDAVSAGAALLADRAAADSTAATRIARAYAEHDGEQPERTLEAEWLRELFATIEPAERQDILTTALTRAITGASALRARQVLAVDPPLAVRLLVARLDRPGERETVVQLLGELRDSGATSALVSVLQDDDPRTRRAAARALGELRDPEAVAALLRRAADRDFAVRDAAQRALDALGTAGVVWSVAAAAHGALEGAAELGGENRAQLTTPGRPDETR